MLSLQTILVAAYLVVGGCALPPTSSNNSTKLNPSCAPGGNFDLSKWTLQLPTGTTGHPDTISSSALQGCRGYQDAAGHAAAFFYTDRETGALVMHVPPRSQCVTTAHSTHCRTELRESSPSSSWDPKTGRNRLAARLTVPQPDDSKYGTVIGQVHIDDKVSHLPVCELYYNTTGHLTMSVEHNPTEGKSDFFPVGSVAPGSTFSYQIIYETGQLAVSINGGAAQNLSTFDLNSPPSYFKVGNYNQGNNASEVHFFEITVEH